MQEQQEVEKSKQQKLLAQRLANRRKDKLDQLANEQRDEIEAEEKKEEEEKAELEKEKLREEETKRISDALAANNGQNNARIVENILGTRQDAEIASLQAKWDKELELELAEIDKSDDPDKETKKKQITNKIQLLHSNELVEMKNRHYQEKLDILTEVAPQTAQQIELDKQNYENTLKELEIQKQENEAKREKERLEWEEAEKERLAKEMELFESELEQQLKDEKAKIEQELKIKADQQSLVQQKQKELMEAEMKSKIESTTNDSEKAKIMDDFNNQISRVNDKSEQDKLRMNDQLKKRLEARKKDLIDSKNEQIISDSNTRKSEFEDTQNDEIVPVKQSNNGPLTAENIDQLLSDSEVCLALKSIQNHLEMAQIDPKEYGELNQINATDLTELELSAYNICLFLLELLQKECGVSCTLQLSTKIPKPDRHIEYGQLQCVNGDVLVLKRSLLSDATGKLIVVLCYAYARIMASSKGTNLQSSFYQTQMIISDQIFKHMN